MCLNGNMSGGGKYPSGHAVARAASKNESKTSGRVLEASALCADLVCNCSAQF